MKDWTRVDALSFSLEQVPLLNRDTLLSLIRMVAAHKNDAFERQISRAKRLASAVPFCSLCLFSQCCFKVGDASFAESFPRDKPSPAGLGTVAAPLAAPSSARGRSHTGLYEESDNDEYTSSSDDEEEPAAWGLCRFIRSFLFIPSVVRGEEDYDYDAETAASSSRSRSRTAQEREIYTSVGMKAPPRVTVTRDRGGGGGKGKEEMDEARSERDEDEEDEEKEGGGSSISQMLGLSQENSSSGGGGGSESAPSPRLSRSSGARLSIAKYAAPNISLTEELWSM